MLYLTSWLSELRKRFYAKRSSHRQKNKGNRCEKLVKYTGQEYVISGANVGVGSFKIDIGSFQNKIKEIKTVPQITIALDTSQYLLCPTKEGPTEKSSSKVIKLKVKPALTEVMNYQGINEAQMQDAIKNLKS